MRKLSGIFLVGLCLGALGAVVATASQGTSTAPVAVAEAVTTTTPDAPDAPDVPDLPSEVPTPTPTPGPPPTPAVDAGKLDKLVGNGRLGAIVFDRQRGAATVSVHANRVYTSASLVKLLIALTVLEQHGPADQVQRMLSRSDDALASQFWVQYGGPSIVTRWASKLKLTGTRPPADPGMWGDTQITAKDVVRIYQYVLAKAPAAILTALRAATERGSDGFRQYFGIPDAAGGRPWAVKQGWSCCNPQRSLHTSGLVGEGDRYIVVVLTEFPTGVDYATGSKRVTDVVAALLG
ncbi:hypothetical protein [Amycolatopsis vastitatis]|uniref:Serine hydrolase n=1 Tax=Amycolatopsis vastitatis TaxID=1905142 RepID=A0A229TL46_9PSEU|nr:hypothetical protein [Amycolatopsis vastitatis]OXM71654.1 hypothetical protein CF165_00940 [Amycolatopsis vastitatis]